MENNETEMRKIFGHRLKKLRTDEDLTLKELSEKIEEKYGIPLAFSTLGNYERGYRVPDLFLFSKLAELFDVTSDYLLGVTEFKNAKALQTNVVDTSNTDYCTKIDKNSNFSNMSINEVREIVKELKSLGIDFDKIN